MNISTPASILRADERIEEGIHRLPKVMLRYILEMLNVRDQICMRLVCKAIRQKGKPLEQLKMLLWDLFIQEMIEKHKRPGTYDISLQHRDLKPHFRRK